MSNGKRIKPWVFIGLAIVLVAAIYVLYRIFGGPAGPVIVIVPDIDPMASASATSPRDYTGWYVDRCIKGTLKRDEAKRDDTYFGVPGVLSSSKGARKITVTRKSGPPLDAVTVRIQLDTNREPLTINLPSVNGVPKWNFGAQIVPHNAGKTVLDWSGRLYGHITNLEVLDTSNATTSVGVADLVSIEMAYNPVKSCP